MNDTAAPVPALADPPDFASPPADGLHRIVIVGGGAAGLALATRLGDTIGRPGGRAAVTLIERARTHIWKPLLHELASGRARQSDHEVEHFAHAYRHNYTYRYGAMVGLDRARRRVEITAEAGDDGRPIMPSDDVPYDTLVIAIGSVSNDFGTPGAAGHAIPLESPAQAARFHRRLVDAFIRADAQASPIRPGQLHVAIIGAGATGTELAAGLRKTTRALVADGLPRIDVGRDVRIKLIEAAPRILPLFPERTANAVQDMLGRQDIEVHTNMRVAEVRADGVALADGTLVASELVVWTAGVKGPELLSGLDGLEATPRHQLLVNADLTTSLDQNVFVIGDCAAAPRIDGDGFVPLRAQAAHQMARHLAREIPNRLDGRPLSPYRYRDYGALVSLGRHTTVGNLKGPSWERSVFVKGLMARMMYASLYKMHEISLHGLGRVAMMTLARSL